MATITRQEIMAEMGHYGTPPHPCNAPTSPRVSYARLDVTEKAIVRAVNALAGDSGVTVRTIAKACKRAPSDWFYRKVYALADKGVLTFTEERWRSNVTRRLFSLAATYVVGK